MTQLSGKIITNSDSMQYSAIGNELYLGDNS